MPFLFLCSAAKFMLTFLSSDLHRLRIWSKKLKTFLMFPTTCTCTPRPVLTQTPINSCLLITFSWNLFLTKTLLLWDPWTCSLFPLQEIFLSSPLSILWPQSSQYQQLGSQDRMEGVIASPTSMLQAASLQWAQLGPGRRCELNQVWSFRLQFERIILISE